VRHRTAAQAHDTKTHNPEPAPVMINNDRILANAAGAPLLMEVPATLRD
jgi:hypothetical protein